MRSPLSLSLFAMLSCVQHTSLTLFCVLTPIPSVFHPTQSGPPQPLDVLSGVTRHGTCATPDGTAIKYYLQKHPVENRLVAVITFENHLSTEYRAECQDSVNEMPFQHISQNDSYVRVATSPMPPGRPKPIITFGNQKSSLRYFEATNAMTKLETDVLEMTKYIHRLIDVALNEAIAHFKIALSTRLTAREPRQQPGGIINGNMSPNQIPQHSKNATFAFPLGNHSPWDSPDSTVAQASKNKPYGHHSDTGPIKNCNHDDSQRSYHCSMMRILTHCFAYVKGNENCADGGINDGKPVVSIRHGIPGSGVGEEDNFCTLLGYFCNTADEFVEVSDTKARIMISFENHAHLQLWGSQGEIHHYVRAERDDAIRIVVSPRLLQWFQQTLEMQELGITSDSSKISRERQHVHPRIMSILSGDNRFILAATLPATLDNNNNLSSSKRPLNHMQKRVIVASAAYPNGLLIEEEKSTRKSVIGIPSSISKENIIRSVYAVEELTQARCTVVLTRNANKSRKVPDKVTIGLFPVQSSTKDYCLLEPGKIHSGLNNSFDITSNRHNKSVLNIEKMDVINIQRLQKNSHGLGANLVTVLNFQASQGKKLLPLVEWELRGQGGAGVLAGSHALDSSRLNAKREAPTHYPPSGQDSSSKHSYALFGLVKCHSCVNVFFKDIYIGLFYAKEATVKEYSLAESLDELSKLKSTLADLHKLQPGLTPKEVTEDISRELSGMMAVTNSIRLVPVNHGAPSLWSNIDLQKGESIPWNVIELSVDDVVKPEAYADKDDVNIETLLGDTMKFKNWSRIIIDHPRKCSFLTESAREKARLDVEEDHDRLDLAHKEAGGDVEEDLDHLDLLPEDYATASNNGTLRLGQLRNAALHSAGITIAKAVGEGLIQNETIIPPRFILDGIVTSRNISYAEASTLTMLKPALTRSLHPPTLLYDPVVILAMAATDTSQILQDLDEDARWSKRNGYSFVLDKSTEDAAFGIIYKCILCCILNPSAVLQLSRHMQKTNLCRVGEKDSLYVPSTSVEDVTQFKKYIGLLQWESRFLHRIFRKGNGFTNAEDFIAFVSLLQKDGKEIFKEAAYKSKDDSRDSLIDHFIQKLGLQNDRKLSRFQVQVILRTIETCIHEPFGNVINVPSGPGGTTGACCLIADVENSSLGRQDITWRKQTTVWGKCQVIPWMIVKWYNKWAEESLNNSNLTPNCLCDTEDSTNKHMITSKTQCIDELLVLGLRWSDELSCLVHTSGIGKKFDSSDAEHMLCMMYCMHQYTLPNRNVTSSNRIDSEKYLPIRNTGGLLAKDMFIMREMNIASKNAMMAYQRLLMDESYCNCILSDIFRIDFSET